MAKVLDLSTGFVLSAGTVTIDPTSQQILLILHNRTKEYMFPKGRKDIGETLSEAAVRETYEETGYKCTLKPHKLLTSAKQGSPRATSAIEHTESIACQQRITAKGKRKIIFWYVGVGDSKGTKTEGTQDEGEDFTSLWVESNKAIEMLTFEDDKQIARLALQAVADTML